MWNNEFEFPDGSYSVSDVQDYIEYIIEKHKKITKVPPASVYSNRINNKLVFKIKDAFNLELQTSEEMNPFVRTKKNNREKKIKKTFKYFNIKRPSIEVIEVVLVQRNLVDNQDDKRYYLLKGKNYNDFINGKKIMIDQLILI